MTRVPLDPFALTQQNNTTANRENYSKMAMMFTNMSYMVTYLSVAELNGHLENKFCVNFNGDRGGRTLLHTACDTDNYAAAEVLLNHNADMSLRDDNQLKPLHLAVKRGNVACVCLLINEGFKVEYKYERRSKRFMDVLHLAVDREHLDTVKILLFHDFGAGLFDKDAEGRTLLEIAKSYKGRTAWKEMLALIQIWQVRVEMLTLLSARIKNPRRTCPSVQRLPIEMLRMASEMMI
jgi:hypothetical protein